MAYPGSPLFKALTDDEEAQFRAYAQQNDPPQGTSWSILHPICREEWIRRGITPPAGEPLYPQNETWEDTK